MKNYTNARAGEREKYKLFRNVTEFSSAAVTLHCIIYIEQNKRPMTSEAWNYYYLLVFMKYSRVVCVIEKSVGRFKTILHVDVCVQLN